MRTLRTLVALLLATACGGEGAGPGPRTPPSVVAIPSEAAGLRVRPLKLTPPATGSAVGKAEVVVENVSGQAIPESWIGSARPLEVLTASGGSSGLAVLLAPVSVEEDLGTLEPGQTDTYHVRLVRIRADDPGEVRGRVMVRDAKGTLTAIGTQSVTLADSGWPVMAPLRDADVAAARGSSVAIHVLMSTHGVFEGSNRVEVASDDVVSVSLSRAGRGDRGTPGYHTNRLDAAARERLLDALSETPLDAWTASDPKRPLPSDVTAFSLLVAIGPRVKILEGSWLDVERCRLQPIIHHLKELMRDVSTK